MTLYSQCRPCDGFVYGVLCSKTHRYTITEDARFLDCLQLVGLWRFYGFLGEHHFLVQGGVIFFDRFQVKVEIFLINALNLVKWSFRMPAG